MTTLFKRRSAILKQYKAYVTLMRVRNTYTSHTLPTMTLGQFVKHLQKD